MKHKEAKYELPEDIQNAMVGESPAAIQYAEDLRYGMEVLSTVSPEELHQIIILLSDYTYERSDVPLAPEHLDKSTMSEEPNETTKAAILEARSLTDKGKASIQPVDTSSVEAMLSSCGI